MSGRRVLRPRATIAVGVVLSTLFVGGAVLLLVAFADPGVIADADRAAIVGIAVVVVAVSTILGRARAVADDDGLVVRNPIRTRRLAWEEIVAVRLGRHDSWAELDLADGTSLPVIAVQSADGARARSDVAWLAARVAEHEGRESPED